MKIPMAIKVFALTPPSWATNRPDAEDEVVFSVAPDTQVRKFLMFIGTKVVVKEAVESDRNREILACGAPVGFRVGRILPKLFPGAPLEYRVVKGDCSQERWTCGGFSVRNVSCKEDVLAELAQGKPRLCVMEHNKIIIRSAMEEYHDVLENSSSKKRAAFNKQVSLPAFDLLPEAVKLSPETRYVIVCHERGSGISSADRARYEQFDEVIKVIAWIDSVANTKFLMKVIRQLYAD